MKQEIYEIISNCSIAASVYELILAGDTCEITAPGQFVNVAIDGCFLRRPISVCDWESGRLKLIYKVVGEGTARLSRMTAGERLDILTGLGNGYDLSRAGARPLLVGGGVGVPPLYALCRRLTASGAAVTAVLGFNTAADVFYADGFRAAGARVITVTADGSAGERGFVTDAIPGIDYTYFYACGPVPMFRAMEKIMRGSGEYSLEERMGCGFGACMGCTCRTLTGNRRICREGPVFRREEILWQNGT